MFDTGNQDQPTPANTTLIEDIETAMGIGCDERSKAIREALSACTTWIRETSARFVGFGVSVN